MTNVLERYGIKEVADVTFYELDDSGEMGAPVLYLDTLKVSTIEQTAEESEARGGKGNPPLIIWDFGKEITVNLEDALFSMKSLATMYGAKVESNNKIKKTISFTGATKPTTWVKPDGTSAPIVGGTIYDQDGKEVTTPVAGQPYLLTFDVDVVGEEINITPTKFAGTYAVVGDTYARSETTGKDEFFQFKIAKAKVGSESTMEMAADGDPATFSMTLRVLRPNEGDMMTLTKYALDENIDG